MTTPDDVRALAEAVAGPRPKSGNVDSAARLEAWGFRVGRAAEALSAALPGFLAERAAGGLDAAARAAWGESMRGKVGIQDLTHQLAEIDRFRAALAPHWPNRPESPDSSAALAHEPRPVAAKMLFDWFRRHEGALDRETVKSILLADARARANPKCPACDGSGMAEWRVDTSTGDDPPRWRPGDCPGCMGTGHVAKPTEPTLADLRERPRTLNEWHDDLGNVIWWRFPIDEPPYVGAPWDDDWPGYHTHWTPIVEPCEPAELGRAHTHTEGDHD